MASALETLKAEQQKLLDDVKSAEELLATRKEALATFRREAMTSLGFSKEGPGNLAARRKLVRPLYLEKLSAAAVAARLSLPLKSVEKDFAYFAKREPLADGGDEDESSSDEETDRKHSAQRPNESVREAVQRLAREGKSSDEICELLDLSRKSVALHLSFMRSKGLVPPASPPPSASPGEEPSFTPGSSVEQIRAEVERQCRESGNRVGPVTIMTTLGGKSRHAHRVTINRMGDGHTTKDDSGHVHRVDHFAVEPAQGHRHALQVQE